jgi:hypothetical protein
VARGEDELNPSTDKKIKESNQQHDLFIKVTKQKAF